MASLYGKYNEILEISKKMQKLYPGHPTFIKSSAIALVKKGKLKKACEKILEYDQIVGENNSLENFKKSGCKN
jgi:predicted Zn-dependent protease